MILERRWNEWGRWRIQGQWYSKWGKKLSYFTWVTPINFIWKNLHQAIMIIMTSVIIKALINPSKTNFISFTFLQTLFHLHLLFYIHRVSPRLCVKTNSFEWMQSPAHWIKPEGNQTQQWEQANVTSQPINPCSSYVLMRQFFFN